MSKPSRKRDDFREWISDNLRYIMLIVCILAALIVLFFGVRAISARIGRSGNAVKTAGGEKSTSVSAAESAAGNEVSDSAANASAQPAENASSDSGTSDTQGLLTPSAEQDVVELIRDYYDALSTQNLAEVQKITDALPESEAASISSTKVSYRDVEVFTKNGPDENSRVVYAHYQYTGGDGDTVYPGLSQMFIRKGADGSWKIVFTELDQETSSHISRMTQEADVQALIAEVKAEYEAASKKAEEAGSTASAASPAATPPAEVSITPEADPDDYAAAADEKDNETESSGTQEGEVPETQYNPDEMWTAVINSSCNVRSGPGYDYGVTGSIAAGEEVTVIGDIDNGWWHIKTDEIDGYVGGKFI